MRGKLAVVALLGVVGLSNAEVIENPILKKLVEKGILTPQEAAAIDEQLAKEEAEKAKYQAEIDKVAMETKDKLDKMDKKFKDMPVLAGKFKKINFEGVGYLGYTYKDNKAKQDTGDFEIRRFYFTSKAYFNDNDYLRLTLDVSSQPHKASVSCDKNGQNCKLVDEGKELDMKVKYAYLYKDISSIIPNTGFELGIVHTPWLDYEEHSGWWYRSIEKTFYEADDGAKTLPSADAGINFKTKTDYVSAEYGIFNGEGYDHLGRNDKGSSGHAFNNSLEGRLTFHVFGNGKKKLDPTKDTYANISAHLLSSVNHRGSDKNLDVYQVHAVYNNPMFLIAAQYMKKYWIQSENGDGYSVNFEVRPVKDWAVFGRWDRWELDNAASDWKKRNLYIGGIAWKMTKNIKWLANVQMADYSGGSNAKPNNKQFEYTKYMLTAEVNW